MRIPQTFRTEKEIEEQKVKELIRKDKVLSDLIQGCDEFLDKKKKIFGKKWLYEEAYKIAQNTYYEERDITTLSKILSNRKREDKILGIYLSALINNKIVRLNKIKLFPTTTLDYLGMYFEKGILIVTEDVGKNFGQYMKGGKIIINGNTSGLEGQEMTGGTIHITGNSGHNTGYKMKEGKILIDKTAGEHTGLEMTGGSIIIKGDVDGRTLGYSMRGGKITFYGNNKWYISPKEATGGEIYSGDHKVWPR